MQITPLRQTLALNQVPRTAPAGGPPLPDDTVQLSESGSRSWLWSSLRSSGLLTAGLVNSPLSGSLNQAQRHALEEAIRESQQRGYRYTTEPGFLEGLLRGGRELELESHQVLDRLDKGVDLRPPGQDLSFRLGNLDQLAALDVLELGKAVPEDTAHPAQARALGNLARAGYRFTHSLARAYRDQTTGSYSWITPPGGQSRTMRHHALAAEDFYRVSGDADSVSDPDFARALGRASAEVGADPAELYELAHQGKATLSRDGVVLGALTEPSGKALEQALSDYRVRGRLLENFFLPLLRGRRVSPEQASQLLSQVTRTDTGLSPEEASSALAQLCARHGAEDLWQSFEGLTDHGWRGPELLERLRWTARVAEGVGWNEADETVEFLSKPPGPGIWALSREERLTHLVALSRLSSPRDARTLMHEELSRAGPVLVRLELLESLLVTSHLCDQEDVATQLRALEAAASDLPAALAAYRQAFQACLGRGEAGLAATTTVALLRGWSTEEVQGAADRMSRVGADPQRDLMSLLAGARPDEPLSEASQRFATLYQSLQAHGQEHQAPRVFPRLAGRESLFQALLSHLAGREQEGDASRLFLALDEQAGEKFPEVFERFMLACLSGQDTETALQAAATRASGAVAEEETRVRLGSVVLRKRPGTP
ncbi:MAG: hypothetical protein AMXMBFR33_43080 [Candidatus Xenobia bacterium]